MPHTFKTLAEKDGTVFEIEFKDGSTFPYTVALNALSYEKYEKYQAMAAQAEREGGDDANDMETEGLQLMAHMLTAWDVWESDGSPTPITVENMKKLPAKMLSTMMDEIKDAMDPNSPSGTSSSNGSAIRTLPKPKPKTAAAKRSRSG